MKIHTDTLTKRDLWRALPGGCYLEIAERGSRSRARAFDVGISADHGTDAHGLKRAYARNSGKYGAAGDGDRAATWVEWGDWIAELFRIDPRAVVGQYDSPADFVRTTTEYAAHRPAREHAPDHAARWARELGEIAEKV